jgi:hypothetical protein
MSGMKRREFITLLGGAAATWPLAARAQRAERVYRVGYLEGSSESSVSLLLAAFRQELQELGYVEGRNLVLHSRSAALPSARPSLHLTQTLVAAGRPKGICAAGGAVAASCRTK